MGTRRRRPQNLGYVLKKIMESKRTDEEKFNQNPDKFLESLVYKKTLELVKKVKQEKPDCLIFLDKSARPLATYFLYAWRKFGNGLRPPIIKFLNIGREVKTETLSQRDMGLMEKFKKDIYAGSDDPKVFVVDELFTNKERSRTNSFNFLQNHLGLSKIEFFPFLSWEMLRRKFPKGDISHLLKKAFPWFVGGQKENLLVQAAGVSEDYFVEPVDESIDKTLGVELRRRIKSYFL